MDTTCYTHVCRAGHEHLLRDLAPGGVVLIPPEVDAEIQAGRVRHTGIPSPSSASWVQQAILTDAELMTELLVKAELGGGPEEHLGECAVIACAHHRGLTAIIDDREAISQADDLSVSSHDTLWIVIEAFKRATLDRAASELVVDDLISTGMYLPITSGSSLFTWAYIEGLLP